MDEAKTTASIGHNRSMPAAIAEEEDLAAQVAIYLEEEFGSISLRVSELLEKARAIPKEIQTVEEMGEAAKLVKDFRDITKEIESHHASAKSPYHRSGQACDSFFFAQWDKCVRRSKTAKPGAADILAERVEAFNRRELAKEQERRRQEEARLRQEAETRRKTAEAEQRKAEEDRLSAERARKPDTAEAKGKIAGQSAEAASAARVEADLAAEKAQAAHIDTLSKPADLVRTRIEGGPLVTMAEESYAVVEDYALLDLEKLRPFLKNEALDFALRSWAKTTGFTVPMAGASIGKRSKSVIR